MRQKKNTHPYVKLCKFYNKQLAKTKQGQVNRAYTITHNHSIHSHKHKQTDTTHTRTRARAKKKTRKQPQIRNFKGEQYNSVCVCVSARVRKKGLYILFFVCFLSG